MYKLYEYKGKKYHIKLFVQMKNPTQESGKIVFATCKRRQIWYFVREKIF
jgi:hypothetical protein